MNIHVTPPAGAFSPLAKPTSLEARQKLEETIDREREALFDRDLDDYQLYAEECALDKLDPRVAEADVKEWKTITRAVVGGVAGAFVGHQGGNVGMFGLGGATAASFARSGYQNGESVGSSAGAGLFFGSIVGVAGSFGGTFGAIVGGLTGAIVAGNLPSLFESSDR